MVNVFCQKHMCVCTLFTILLFCSCGYLFYVGWWIPIAVNTHRLRHAQLVPFEIYAVSVSDWYRYSIGSEKMSILTYRQMEDYDYAYLLGSIQPSNFSVQIEGLDHLDINETATPLSNDTSGLFPVSWPNWIAFVDEYLEPSAQDTMYILQYSKKYCVKTGTNETEINQCFEDWVVANNASGEDVEYFVYTPLSQQIDVNVNSIDASTTLDGPRDVFIFIIMMFCFIWFFLVVDFFEDPEIGWEAVNYLIITMFFIGAYYLWVFVLSVVPVFFSLPMARPGLDYYRQAMYSLTYTVGDYDPLWWVTGVVVSGIWAYVLILFVPALGVIYLSVACLCCCDEDRTDTWGACLIIPVMLIGVCIIIIFTFAYYILFIGNMVFWNTATYKDMTDDNVIQAVTAVLVFFFLVPLMSMCLSWTTKYNKKYAANEKRKMIHRAGTSLQRLPVVKNRLSSSKKSVRAEQGTESERIAMTTTSANGGVAGSGVAGEQQAITAVQA
eukprot:CAMPEP_0202687862 /NCGR_PEP_ID=MMETSP1385-20130828/3442_1 /ASSEMBLY_ACC=CAM_ASM_000861 /TAXON_ID=933848 /ORGANISM="Elphidium margaritaceum" /LENGTH=495 /DNA_ID=CAMNT_0049342713 /DNA_START=29 /DNA_END=1516 /DNA_ORIENTATION=-